MKITKLETTFVRPRWLFLKMHTDEGIVGLGEPILEGRSQTVAAAVQEIGRFVIGMDPRDVVAGVHKVADGEQPFAQSATRMEPGEILGAEPLGHGDRHGQGIPQGESRGGGGGGRQIVGTCLAVHGQVQVDVRVPGQG